MQLKECVACRVLTGRARTVADVVSHNVRILRLQYNILPTLRLGQVAVVGVGWRHPAAGARPRRRTLAADEVRRLRRSSGCASFQLSVERLRHQSEQRAVFERHAAAGGRAGDRSGPRRRAEPPLARRRRRRRQRRARPQVEQQVDVEFEDSRRRDCARSVDGGGGGATDRPRPGTARATRSEFVDETALEAFSVKIADNDVADDDDAAADDDSCTTVVTGRRTTYL